MTMPGPAGAQNEPSAPIGVTTQRVAEARTTITQTPVTPKSDTGLSKIADRVRGIHHGERSPALAPYPGAAVIRLVLSVLFAVLCLLTVGGAILLLLLWQQDRSAGILTSQLDRTWDLLETLAGIERIVAFAVVPVAMVWIALAAINAGRATGNHRNPIVAALSLPIGLGAAWYVGKGLVFGSDDTVNQGLGFAIQIACLAFPVIFLERITTAAEARHRPLRATWIISIAYLAVLEFLGGLSTIDRESSTGQWGQVGAYLLIGGLLQVIGALSANEACRSVEDGTQHRYDLRSRFSESLLAQAAMR